MDKSPAEMRTLVRHRDIQNWVNMRRGMPAMIRQSELSGEIRARLSLNFRRPQQRPTVMPEQDDGMSPCSWTAWLAELDRQHLALRVSEDETNFELVERQQHAHRLN